MLEYDRIDMSEWTGVNKTKEWLRCIICNFKYFLGVNCRYVLVAMNAKGCEFQCYHCFC